MSFYISKFRYKLALACVAGIIIIFFNAFSMGMPLHEIINEYGITFVVLLALGIYCWYPAFRYAAGNPEEIWHNWGYQSRQKERKDFEDFQFDCVYENTMYGMAKESGKGYRTLTTLESCTCAEFRKNKEPCKHMYKLADILNLYEEEYKRESDE